MSGAALIELIGRIPFGLYFVFTGAGFHIPKSKMAEEYARSKEVSLTGSPGGKGCWRLSDTLGLRPMGNRPTIVEIMQILEDSLTAEGIEQWLRAPNRLLGGDARST
jgi:hypothetical protein